MAQRSEHRRRMAVALVALVAAAATIATSQGTPQAGLAQTTSATVVLDAGAPRKTGRLVLTISAEALPVVTGAVPDRTGYVEIFKTFTDPGGGSFAGSRGPIEVTASAVGVAEPSHAGVSGPSWPIEELCRPAEPCRRAFDVTVEWLQPPPGSAVTVSLEARLQVTYMQTQTAPNGATAAWETGEFAPVSPAPALSARADLGSVTLGRESPFAARHVQLRGSAAILDDSKAVDVTAFVRWEPSGDRPLRVTMTITPDTAEGRPLGGGAVIQPFVGCPPAKECIRGFTILARWAGVEPDDQVHLEWSFDAVARFPGGTRVPDGATMAAEVDDALDLDAMSSSLHAQTEGSFGLPRGNQTVGRVRLLVSAPALDDAFFGAYPPAVAVVRVRAAVKDPATPAGLRAWVSVPDYGSGASNLPVADDGTELTTVVYLLTECADVGQCSGWIEISVDNPAGREATISWQVTIDLPVPQAARRVGQLKLEVEHAP